ncbi:general stress protein [Rhodococcus sp. IEGM 1408]|uniref:general stress protein n=1 Tax=Rhodococcus sp. IEGM 1408 TaxID=3082220 RepID=UPI0029543C52|nr:general stress protein [Rhodococcus sp. IEGM 1408]MDV8000583.1 general stress protein [Rhodococcus sp. IEGM 1408]
MTTPVSPSPGRRGGGKTPGLPTPPTGWVVGSYPTYAQAQAAVDHLADEDLPVHEVTIVGVDLMQVERVTGRLTWPKVLLGGLATGAWLGLFVGLLLGMFTQPMWGVVLTGLIGGSVFGVVSASLSYAATRGKRDFASTSQLVAGRYDILCEPANAERVRDELARLGLK